MFASKKKKVASIFSLKISWDRARAERAILRIFGGIRAAGVGPKKILKIERWVAKYRRRKIGGPAETPGPDDAPRMTRRRPPPPTHRMHFWTYLGGADTHAYLYQQ